MTNEEKQKAIDALKISAPVRVMAQEEFNDYIQTLNKIMDWLEQKPCEDWYDVPSDEITLEQARQAVKDLRKKLAEYKEPTTKHDSEVDKLLAGCEKMSFEIEIFNKPLRVVALDAVKNIVKDLFSVTSQEPTTKNDLGVDCIDRQATLDAIIKRLGIRNESYLLQAERVLYQQIKDMPSVTPQPCEDAVSRQAVLEMAKSYNTGGWDMYTPLVVDVEDIEELPPVIPIRPKGHWIVAKGGSYLGKRNAYCSNCKDFYTNDWNDFNFCPNCSADMREVEE